MVGGFANSVSLSPPTRPSFEARSRRKSISSRIEELGFRHDPAPQRDDLLNQTSAIREAVDGEHPRRMQREFALQTAHCPRFDGALDKAPGQQTYAEAGCDKLSHHSWAAAPADRGRLQP